MFGVSQSSVWGPVLLVKLIHHSSYFYAAFAMSMPDTGQDGCKRAKTEF